MSSFLGVDRGSWHSLFAAQIGWMLDAMDFLLFSFAVVPIAIEFHLSKASMGALTSVALIAGGIGGIVFGRLADRIGRVRALTFSILLYSLATAGLATATAPWQLAVWRTLVGLGMGGEWSCGSVLVAETWPAEHRGKAMGLMQSGWAIGALIAAAVSGLTLARFGWRVLFLIGALPAVAVPLFAFYARTPATLLTLGPLVGFFVHGYFSLFGAMLAELFPTRIRGSAQGFCYNSGRIASAFAPIAIGAAAQGHAFAEVISAAAAFFGVGAVLVWLLPETKGAEL